MSFQIDKGVHMDTAGYTLKKQDCPYPFEVMLVGDSFFVAADVASLGKNRSNVANWVARWRKLTGDKNFNVSTRTVENGFRVWRVS